MSAEKLADALPHFDDMTALQRRLHNAAIVLGADGDEYGFENLLREAIAALDAHSAEQEQAGEAVADWSDVRMELEAAGRVDLSVWVERNTRPQQPLTPDSRADLCEAWLQGGGAGNIVDAYEAGFRDAERAHGITKDTK